MKDSNFLRGLGWEERDETVYRPQDIVYTWDNICWYKNNEFIIHDDDISNGLLSELKRLSGGKPEN